MISMVSIMLRVEIPLDDPWLFWQPWHLTAKATNFDILHNIPFVVGGLELFLFFHILGISSSQLTFIFLRGVGIPPSSILFSFDCWVIKWSPSVAMTSHQELLRGWHLQICHGSGLWRPIQDARHNASCAAGCGSDGSYRSYGSYGVRRLGISKEGISTMEVS